MKKVAAIMISALVALSACGTAGSETSTHTRNAALVSTATAQTCRVVVVRYTVTPCRPITSITTEFYRYSTKVFGLSTRSVSSAPNHSFYNWSFGNRVTRMSVSYTLDNGGTIGPFFVPYYARNNLRFDTTYAIPPTTTTTTTTTTTSTTTSTVPVTTLSTVPAATCVVKVQGYIVTPCLQYKTMTTEWYDDTKKVVDGYSSKTSDTLLTTHSLRSSWMGGNPTRALVSYTLANNGVIGKFFVPYAANTDISLNVPYSVAPPMTTTTTLPTAVCAIRVSGYTVTPCRPYKYMRTEWYDDSSKIINGYSSDTDENTSVSQSLRASWMGGNPTRAFITYTLGDGAVIGPFFVPYAPNTDTSIRVAYTVPPPTTTTLPPVCKLTIRYTYVTTCKPFRTESHQWWNESASLSGTIGGTTGTARSSIELRFPNAGTTRALVTFNFTDGTSVGPLFIPTNSSYTQLTVTPRK